MGAPYINIYDISTLRVNIVKCIHAEVTQQKPVITSNTEFL